MGECLFLGCAILSIVNGAILLWINPRRTVNQAFFLCCVCICLWCLCVFLSIRKGQQNPTPLEALHFWLRASSGVGAFLCWLIWLTKTALIERHLSIRAILRKSWPWFALSCGVAGIAFSESFIPSTATPEAKQHGIGYITYFAVITISCTVFLIDALRRDRELSGIRKIELRYFVLNAIIACLLVVLAHAVSFYIDSSWLRRAGLIFFTLLNGAAVWAICHHRVFDAKHIVTSVGQRALLLSLLGAMAVVLQDFLHNKLPTHWDVFLATVATISTGILCDRPIRWRLGLDASQMQQAPRKVIIEISRTFSNEETLRIKFSELLQNWYHTNNAIFLGTEGNALSDPIHHLEQSWPGFTYLTKNGWATPETLQRVKSEPGTLETSEFLSRNDFGILLAAPKGRNPPSLVVCLGQKESLRPYTFPDIDVLLGLVELMDNILTHSRAAANAAQIEKMETAAMMSRGLAHDLSNLATPVSSFLIHMENQVKPGSVEATVLADAKLSIGVMQKYIEESLFLTRALAPKTECVEVHQLLSSVTRICQERAKSKGITIAVTINGASRFLADHALMQRLLQNLVLNAIDASPNGGEIKLNACINDEGRIAFEVSDHGTGIAPGIIDRIFEPYFTTKEGGSALRGLGLGLAICRKIADLHLGYIAVSSDRQTGTTFKVILPLVVVNPAQMPVDQLESSLNLKPQPQPI